MDNAGDRPRGDGGAPAGARLRLQLLGPFALADEAGFAVTIRSRRARGLIAYLHLQPRHSELRARLSGLFWSDRAESQARASLRQCLTEIRAALPEPLHDYMVVERELVSLRAGAFTSDVAEIQGPLADAHAEALASALDQAGPATLLEDLELPGLFAEWLEPTREEFERRLAEGVTTTLRRLADQVRTDGSGGDESGADRELWTRIRRLAAAYLRRDPANETVCAFAMRAEAALGDAAAARRRFQALAAALDKAYGVTPGPEARAALEQAPVARTARAAPPSAPAKRPGAAAADAEPARPDLAPLLVVATMDGQTPDSADRFLGAAIRDEVIVGLSNLREVRVAPASVGIMEIVDQPWAQGAAAYVIGGRIARTDAGLRLTAQLIRTTDRQVIWSRRVEAPDSNVADTVEQIVTQVAGAVFPTVNADLERGARARPDSLYHRFVAARAASAAASTYEAARQAAADLEALIVEDPAFVLPYLPLAGIYNTDFGYTRAGAGGPKERARARDLAKAALSLDRGHTHAYTVAGWGCLWQGDWNSARAHFDQAMRLNPYHADRVMEAGFGYLHLGDLERADAMLRRCLALSPTPQDTYCKDLGMLEIMRGAYGQAARYLDLVARPSIWDTVYKAVAATLDGRTDAALNAAAVARIAAIWPPGEPMTGEAMLAWVRAHHPFAVAEMADRFMGAAARCLR